MTTYSEEIFRTLKYRPCYPCKPFADMYAAREWVHGFTHWYNEDDKVWLNPDRTAPGEPSKAA